jgi:hypothetical protein
MYLFDVRKSMTHSSDDSQHLIVFFFTKIMFSLLKYLLQTISAGEIVDQEKEFKKPQNI